MSRPGPLERLRALLGVPSYQRIVVADVEAHIEALTGENERLARIVAYTQCCPKCKTLHLIPREHDDE